MSQTPIIRAAARRTDKRRRKRKNRFLRKSKKFIERDKPVFPIAANSKIPLTTHGFKDATTDPRQIEDWAEEHPQANIGIPTGSASGFVVIDLDRKGGVDGVKEFEVYCDQWKIKLPKTYRVQTPSGGQHIFFRSPKYAGKIRISASVLAKGIDVRAEGGYVVAQGSSIDGKNYEVIEGDLDNIALLPKPLRLRLLERRRARSKSTNGHGRYRKGERNDHLFRDICSFRASGKTYERALDLGRALNLSNCKPPLTDNEVVNTVKSAFSYENSPTLIESPEKAQTEMGNSLRFAITNEGRLAYVHELKQWYFRDDASHWGLTPGIEFKLAKQSVRDLLVEASKLDDLEAAEKLTKFAFSSQRKYAIGAMLNLAQSEDELSRSLCDFDNKPWEFAVANGVVNLKTGHFRGVAMADNFLNVSPVTYDAKAKCPEWHAALRRWLPDPAVRRFLQKAIGLSLIGAVLDELILFLYGPSGSGKSTFINTMMAMFGPELGIKIPTSALLTGVRGGNIESSAIAKLRGARFASCSELPQKRSFNESAVKDLSSRDIIFAKALYENPIQFSPSHTLFLYGNQKPSVSASDSGFWRRMKEIPFDQVIAISEMDANLDQKLLCELAGIFNWGIQGCLAYQKDGLTSPKAIRRATKHYQSEVDVIGRFLRECTVKGHGERVTANALFKAFQEYAEDSNEFIKDITQTKFGNTLANTPYKFEKDRKKIRGRKVTMYFGLGLK
ncbi:MAG: phage/plasmid primase, P4 family [Calditrichaeota bacterium]|nr:phage/plasmid primase, P4 family [Calditrichota bacterium]